MKKENKQGLIGCGMIILIIIVVVTVLSVNEMSNEKKIKDLISKVDEYASMKGDYQAKPAASPLKVFIVQNREKANSKGEIYEYSPLYFHIADDLRAKTPSEMNTLIQLNRTTSATGKYTSGKIAYSRFIDVTVIDIASGKVIFTDTFVGSAPYTLIGNDSPYGDWPDSDVTGLIKKLATGYSATPSPNPNATPDILN